MIPLPAGTRLIQLKAHPDSRGAFMEIFRNEWDTGIKPVQWNAVRSHAGTLRGVHVHPIHDDYLLLPMGRASIGLRDLRRGSPTEGLTAMVPLASEEPAALKIPHGVAHGFLFHAASLHIYAVSAYWNLADELGCRWDDPELGLAWPLRPDHISEKDAAAQSFRELIAQLDPWQPIPAREPDSVSPGQARR